MVNRWFYLDCITVINTFYSIDTFLFNFYIQLTGLSWSWSYGSLIYNYLCNQCLLSLTLWVPSPLMRGVIGTTICDKVCQWLATGRWFSPGTQVSSTNNTDRHDIIEILLEVALSNQYIKLTIRKMIDILYHSLITCEFLSLQSSIANFIDVVDQLEQGLLFYILIVSPYCIQYWLREITEIALSIIERNKLIRLKPIFNQILHCTQTGLSFG